MGIWGSFISSFHFSGVWLLIHCAQKVLSLWKRNVICDFQGTFPFPFSLFCLPFTGRLIPNYVLPLPYFLPQPRPVRSSSRLTITFVRMLVRHSEEEAFRRLLQKRMNFILDNHFFVRCSSAECYRLPSSVLAERLFCRYFINPLISNYIKSKSERVKKSK